MSRRKGEVAPAAPPLPQEAGAARGNLALSQALTRQIPPFVTCGDIFPQRGKSFLKGRASGETGHLALEPEALPPCQGLSPGCLSRRKEVAPRSAATSTGSRRCREANLSSNAPDSPLSPAVTSSPEGGKSFLPLAKPVTWHLSRKLYRHAKASPLGEVDANVVSRRKGEVAPRSAAASTGSRRCRSNLAPLRR